MYYYSIYRVVGGLCRDNVCKIRDKVCCWYLMLVVIIFILILKNTEVLYGSNYFFIVMLYLWFMEVKFCLNFKNEKI